MDDIIDKYYVEFNFPNVNKLYKILKDKNIDVTKKDVDSYVKRQNENQLIAQTQTIKKNYGHITAMAPNEEWQIDIFVFDKYYRQNNGFKYMLCAVDIFTRKAMIEPMKTKNIEDTSKAISKLITLHGQPMIISSDNDAAFTGEKFQAIINKYDIIHNTNIMGDHFALGVIDRFARTLKTILNKMIIRNKNTNWMSHINDIVKKYNNSPNASLLDLSPNEVMKNMANFEAITDLNVSKNKKNNTVSDLNIDDNVRVKVKGKFDKGSEPTFSDEIYTVKNINGKTITLNDDKRYKRTNLLLVPKEEKPKSSKTNEIKQAKKSKKQEVILNREDININNSLDRKRTRKPTKKALESF